MLSSILHLLVVRSQELGVDSNFRWCQSWGRDELKSRVTDELPGQPQERFLKVVVGFSRDIVVLEVLLAMEGDGLRLNLTLLHVHLVSSKNDRDVLANSDKVT